MIHYDFMLLAMKSQGTHELLSTLGALVIGLRFLHRSQLVRGASCLTIPMMATDNSTVVICAGANIVNRESIAELEATMAWIRVITESEAAGRLKDLYDKVTEPWGGVDNILKIHSSNENSLKVHYDLYAHLMRGRSDLSRAQREMIAVVASVANHCHY